MRTRSDRHMGWRVFSGRCPETRQRAVAFANRFNFRDHSKNLSPKQSRNHKEVFGEAFFKKLQKNAAFLKKGDIQKLLSFRNPAASGPDGHPA
ncbi:hypothetical protein F1542_12930 [Komagataeibacter sp. FXV3]|nr:hypothetical protein [Komagataeibacter sp. FXV3]